MMSIVEDVEERKALYMVDMSINWCSHYGK